MNSRLSERISDLYISVKQLICIVSGTGGSDSGASNVITATNLLTPRTNWVVLSTNSHDNAGNFSVQTPAFSVQFSSPNRIARPLHGDELIVV